MVHELIEAKDESGCSAIKANGRLRTPDRRRTGLRAALEDRS